MFDFHLHSSVSFDSTTHASDIVKAAERLGLREICFTDHYEFTDTEGFNAEESFDIENYERVYGSVGSKIVKIGRGVEFGLTENNQRELDELCQRLDFDFVIGSVHNVNGVDPWFAPFWEKYELHEGFEAYLTRMLDYVRAHDNFDVLGHMTHVSKSPFNVTREPLLYRDYADVCDEIMRTLAEKGKGMEINTSGVDRVGEFLPSLDFVKRFRELGGEIITVGSDSHDTARVGQYVDGALAIANEVFGRVYTFEKRHPIIHKL